MKTIRLFMGILRYNCAEKCSGSLPEAQQNAILSAEGAMTNLQYSWRTIKSYRSHLGLFFAFFSNKNPETIQQEDVKIYLSNQIREKYWAEATQQQALNAIHFYFKHILNRPIDFAGLRPKNPPKLPLVLSRQDVAAIFRAVGNVKHRSMLMLIYSAGLRLSELTNLCRLDIQFENMRVFVKGGPRKKDRYTLLSEKMASYLCEYLSHYEPRNWLFEGRDGGRYSNRSIEAIFQRALKRVGIQTLVSVRSLRHSFAIHLLEQGIDIHYIQELLGHESLKTTGVYSHLARKQNQRLMSPLDRLDCLVFYCVNTAGWGYVNAMGVA